LPGKRVSRRPARSRNDADRRLFGGLPRLQQPSTADSARMPMETVMERELKTEKELIGLVVAALDANPDTAGWIPTGLHEEVDDEDGCNWNITHLHRDRKDADVRDVALAAAAGIINDLRSRYNLR
jgi:hypothetical protein